LENKKSEFIQLVNYRNQIKSAMDKFESVLFDKYYIAMQKSMKNYYSDLEMQYYILLNQKQDLRASDYSLRLAQLEQQMWNVNHILGAKKLDDIVEVLSSYIYLKKKLE
jgi:acyl carrier protein phosphodiesterase